MVSNAMKREAERDLVGSCKYNGDCGTGVPEEEGKGLEILNQAVSPFLCPLLWIIVGLLVSPKQLEALCAKGTTQAGCVAPDDLPQGEGVCHGKKPSVQSLEKGTGKPEESARIIYAGSMRLDNVLTEVLTHLKDAAQHQ
jgi:hypothetical protein